MWFETKISGIYKKEDLIGFVAISRDITKRKFSEEKMREHCSALSDFKDAIIDREEKIIELKKEIEELKSNIT